MNELDAPFCTPPYLTADYSRFSPKLPVPSPPLAGPTCQCYERYLYSIQRRHIRLVRSDRKGKISIYDICAATRLIHHVNNASILEGVLGFGQIFGLPHGRLRPYSSSSNAAWPHAHCDTLSMFPLGSIRVVGRGTAGGT
jgi:hypothetical protein